MVASHFGRILQLLDAPAELEEASADRGIGDAFEVAGNELVGHAEARGDGAEMVLDEGAVVAGIGRIGELDVRAGRQRNEAPGLHADVEHAVDGAAGIEAGDRPVRVADEETIRRCRVVT